MATVLTYTQKRDALFGLKSKTDTITVTAPATKFQDYKRYHIYVVCDGGKEQKVHTSFTLVEARALILYEREETEDSPPAEMYQNLWGDYGQQFKWIVKDTKEYTTYTYNPITRSLDLNLA